MCEAPKLGYYNKRQNFYDNQIALKLRNHLRNANLQLSAKKEKKSSRGSEYQDKENGHV